MRTRSTSSSSPQTVVYDYTQWNNSADPTVQGPVSGTIYNDVSSSVMQDVVTPNYRKLQARGIIVNNPMSKVDSLEKYSGGLVAQSFKRWDTQNPTKYTGFTAVGTWLGSIYQNPNRYLPPASIDQAALQDKAIISAHEKCSANSAEILATMGEMKETVHSLVSIFTRALGILKAVKRFDLKHLAGEITPKELANRWMEARYAIRPLFYDAANVVAALSQKEKSRRWNARGSVTETSTTADSSNVVIYSNMYYIVKVKRTTIHSVTARAGVLACYDDLSQLSVWGVDRIMTSAWELFPMSFVVDWFFNVGKTIAAWQPSFNVTKLASWIIIEEMVTQSCVVKESIPLWPTSNIVDKYFNYSAMCYKVTTSKVRTPNPSLPVLPSINIRLDVPKLLDLGLIMKNLFK